MSLIATSAGRPTIGRWRFLLLRLVDFKRILVLAELWWTSVCAVNICGGNHGRWSQ